MREIEVESLRHGLNDHLLDCCTQLLNRFIKLRDGKVDLSPLDPIRRYRPDKVAELAHMKDQQGFAGSQNFCACDKDSGFGFTRSA